MSAGNGHDAGGTTPSAAELARLTAKPQRPKRFYKEVDLREEDGRHAVTLDGRVARTPGRALLAVADHRVAEALRDEWAAQAEEIDPTAMPLTRLVNAAIDGVADREELVRQDIVAYAGTDLVAYRATEPQGLIDRQAELWDPVIAFVREAFGAEILTANGIVHVAQPAGSIEALAAALAEIDGLSLAAVHSMTTLTGSALIALAVARGALSVGEAWKAAHVDEDWEIALWGEDAEAMARREARWKEMRAAALVLGRL